MLCALPAGPGRARIRASAAVQPHDPAPRAARTRSSQDDAARWSGHVGAAGEHWWGGAAGTAFWIDPQYDVIAILMMQRFQAEPLRERFRTLVNAAIE